VDTGILIIDESGDLGTQDGSSKYFFIGGIYFSSFDEEQVKTISDAYIGKNTKGSQLTCEDLDHQLELLYNELKSSVSSEPIIVCSWVKKKVINSFVQKHPKELYTILSSFVIDELLFSKQKIISKVIFDYADSFTEFTENALVRYYTKIRKAINFHNNKGHKFEKKYAHVKLADLVANSCFKYHEKQCYNPYNLTRRYWEFVEIHDEANGRKNMIWKRYHKFREMGIWK